MSCARVARDVAVVVVVSAVVVVVICVGVLTSQVV